MKLQCFGLTAKVKRFNLAGITSLKSQFVWAVKTLLVETVSYIWSEKIRKFCCLVTFFSHTACSKILAQNQAQSSS